MYEKCVKDELDKWRMNAVITANATVYSSPAYSKESARQKQRSWQRFMDSLSWEKVTSRKKKQSPETIEKVFNRLKIPVAKGKKNKKGVDK